MDVAMIAGLAAGAVVLLALLGVIAALLVAVLRLVSKVEAIADKLVAAQVAVDEDTYARFQTLREEIRPRDPKPEPASDEDRRNARRVI